MALFTRDLRLVGGNYPSKGRLEIYHNSTWGTICDDGFTTPDANVACRQLGYRTSSSTSYMAGGGTGPIWLDDMSCDGTERRIDKCSHRGWNTHDCGHGEDVGVRCTGEYDESAVVFQCYSFQFFDRSDYTVHVDDAVTNIWCEHFCKITDTNCRYSGTISDRCFCGNIILSENSSKPNEQCTFKCPGNKSEICGGPVHPSYNRMTVSEIERAYESFTFQNTQATSVTSDSKKASTTVDYMNMITSDTTAAKVTKYTPSPTPEVSSNTAMSIVTVVKSTQSTPKQSTETVTETVTVTNTQATSATFLSIRDPTTAYFMKMITSDIYLTTFTQITPNIIQKFSSTATENIDTAISVVMTKTSTQTTIANGEWGIWNDWKFCEVNCVREDTTNGTQRRWRTCNGSICSGKDMEERACSEPEICKGMRPRKLLCKCPKRLINTKWHNLDGKNITDAEVKKIVLEDFNKNTKSKISINKKTASKEVRKKNSAVNKRKSSQSIGWGCIVFLVLPTIFLIAIDILNCCIHLRSRFGGRKRKRIRSISTTHNHRESTKPLQENVNATESYYASRCGNNFHPDEMKRETYQRRRYDNNQLGRDKWLQYM